MIINHNLSALNANRMMNINSGNANKSMQKLSTGLRINKAGDDAAGLAISEKMRGQIRGLDQASANASDGISMIQTAEGALNETTSILQRMRELAVQGSNDTNTTEDRVQIQKEMNQLTAEISRVGNDTEFNTQKLLQGGSVTGGTTGTPAGTGAVSGVSSVTGNEATPASTTFTISSPLSAGDTLEVGGQTITSYADAAARTAANAGAGDAYGVLATDTADAQATAIRGMTFTGVTTGGTNGVVTLTQDAAGTGDITPPTAGASITDVSSVAGAAEQIGSTTFTITTALSAGDTLVVGGQTITSYADAAARTAAGNEAYGVLATDSAADQATAIRGMEFADRDVTGSGAEVIITQTAAGTGDVTGPVVTNAPEVPGSGGTGATSTSFTFQIGANQSQQFTATISDMRSAALGIAGTAGNGAAGVNGDVVGASYVASGASDDLSDVTTTGEHGLDISDSTKATAAIKVIDQATSAVSAERAKLGAYSNRLEHTIANLGTSSENLTSAESRIRDVDMAKEMSTFSKNNILSQAAQAMLAQANQQPQQVLQLLR